MSPTFFLLSCLRFQSSGGGETKSEYEAPESSVRGRKAGVYGPAAQDE